MKGSRLGVGSLIRGKVSYDRSYGKLSSALFLFIADLLKRLKPIFGFENRFTSQAIRMQGKVPETEEIKFRAIRNDALISNDESSQSLIAFNLQDVNMFTAIYKKLFPSVYYYAKRFVTSEEAQDLTADVFTKLWNTEKKFPNIQSIKSYLQVSVRNAAINYNEHQKIIEKNKDNIISLNELVDFGFNEYDEIKAEKIKLIFVAIDKLPLQQKKVFELFYFVGLKEKEIAVKLNIAMRTVHNHKMVALKKIRLTSLTFYMFFTMILFLV